MRADFPWLRVNSDTINTVANDGRRLALPLLSELVSPSPRVQPKVPCLLVCVGHIFVNRMFHKAPLYNDLERSAFPEPKARASSRSHDVCVPHNWDESNSRCLFCTFPFFFIRQNFVPYVCRYVSF